MGDAIRIAICDDEKRLAEELAGRIGRILEEENRE